MSVQAVNHTPPPSPAHQRAQAEVVKAAPVKAENHAPPTPARGHNVNKTA